MNLTPYGQVIMSPGWPQHEDIRKIDLDYYCFCSKLSSRKSCKKVLRSQCISKPLLDSKTERAIDSVQDEVPEYC